MKKVLISLLFVLFLSCDGGLTLPSDIKTGFGGVVTFVGKWPPPDSLKDLRIIASPIYPIDTTKTNLIVLVLDGTIQVHPPLGESSLPLNVSVHNYRFELPAGNYKYVAVFQQYAVSLLAWRPLGVFTGGREGFQPEPIALRESEFLTGIDVTVNFNNLPPLPF